MYCPLKLKYTNMLPSEISTTIKRLYFDRVHCSIIFQVGTSLVSSLCTRGISYRGRKRGLLTCFPDTDLGIAKQLMEAKGIKQLPVVKHGVEFQEERKRRIVAILYYDAIWNCLR